MKRPTLNRSIVAPIMLSAWLIGLPTRAYQIFAAGQQMRGFEAGTLEHVFSEIPSLVRNLNLDAEQIAQTHDIALLNDSSLTDTDYQIAANLMGPFLDMSPELLKESLSTPPSKKGWNWNDAVERLRSAQKYAQSVLQKHSLMAGKTVRNGGSTSSLAYGHDLNLSDPRDFGKFFVELVSARRLFGEKATKAAFTEAYKAIRQRAELREELIKLNLLNEAGLLDNGEDLRPVVDALSAHEEAKGLNKDPLVEAAKTLKRPNNDKRIASLISKAEDYRGGYTHDEYAFDVADDLLSLLDKESNWIVKARMIRAAGWASEGIPDKELKYDIRDSFRWRYNKETNPLLEAAFSDALDDVEDALGNDW